MSILQKLTEGVQSRDLRAEGAALLNKWEATGLLEGLNTETQKQGMAVLLENQAKELLREASSMAAGDVEGFAAVAFPIVRRVFGGLIANDLVSVQPMSLPSGLIFFLDFTHEDSRLGAKARKSVYGGDKVASGIASGVSLADGGADGEGAGGHYNLGHGHASATGSVTVAWQPISAERLAALGGTAVTDQTIDATMTDAQKKAIRFDADILAAGGKVGVYETTADILGISGAEQLDVGNLAAITGEDGADANFVRRLTRIVDDRLIMVAHDPDGSTAAATELPTVLEIPLQDNFGGATTSVGAVLADDIWSLENQSDMAEIDIKVDSIAVTAQTKKLKAKWSPELGQDLNAYHNLDAEVELTGILSEQIALEIDRELLGELVNGATAGTRYWSRAPGLFVDSNGNELGASSAAPDFTGTVSEWYETLIETINDVSAQIHRKTLRGGANFVVCSPEVANILEFTSGFRAAVTADQDRGTIGAVRAGSLSKKFDVYVDPYFLRNVILVGRKGSSFLESGFVYAPYVPLQVTPTIFGTEDFVPRKGVMTRYAKKMVRPDMYGLVVVRGLLGEEGA
jgi:hypothetical protein